MTSTAIKATIPAALAALALPCLLAAPAWAQDKLHYAWSWIPTGEYAPFTAGLEKGFFKELNLDVTYSTGRGSGDSVKKVAGGAAPVGDGDISAVMAARVREKAPVKCIMSQHTQSPHALFVLESSGIKTLKDIAGKTLVTTPGNSHFLYFPLVAKMNGIDPNSVKWITADAPTMGPMLISKKVDGAPLFATHEKFQNRNAEKAGEKIRSIPFADYGFKIYSYCWHAHEDVIKNQPDQLKRFVRGIQRSYLWARDNVQEAATLHNKRHPEISVQDGVDYMGLLFKYMFNEFTELAGFGRFDAARLKETYRVVAIAQELDAAIDPASFVDESLLPPKK